VTSGFAAPAAAVLNEVVARVVDAGLPDAAVFEVIAALDDCEDDDAVCGAVVSAAAVV
jgi:hypothetical protein